MKFSKSFLIGNTLNHFRQKIVFPNGHTFSKPIAFSIAPTSRCNCRCIMCHFYKLKEKDMPYDVIIEILTSLKKWIRYPYFIDFSGGEILQYKDIYKVIKFCSKNNIYSKITTNGALFNKNVCDRLIDSGLEYLSVSIDSLNHKTHDSIRGMPGVLEKVLWGIKYLVDNNIKVGVTTVISGRNVMELENITKTLFDKYNICRIAFQPIEPLTVSKEHLIKNNLWITDMEKLKYSISRLNMLYNQGYNIINKEKNMQNFIAYFRDTSNKEFKKLHRCMAGETNYYIDLCGDIRFCWNLNSFGNIYAEDFNAKNSWNSEKAKKIRLQTLKCTKNCTAGCYRSLPFLEKSKYYFFLKDEVRRRRKSHI